MNLILNYLEVETFRKKKQLDLSLKQFVSPNMSDGLDDGKSRVQV